MKAEDSRQVDTDEEMLARNAGRASSGAETDVTTRLRTKAEWAQGSGLMEVVCERGNLMLAYQRVVKNKGAAGVDGIGIAEFKGHLKQHWPTIKATLLEGTYMPHAVRRVDIPKPQGGVRTLGIPTLTDRLIQQALHQVLSPIFEATFSESSYGFRPGRNAHQAVKAAKQYVAEGRRIVVDMDLEKFFDTVNHDVLMSRVARRISDKRVLKLIRAFLNSGMMDHGLVEPTEEGVPQGGPLSPLLSNILLDELDKELEKRKLNFVRYADDCNIYVASERAGDRVMKGITQFLAKKLRLKVNAEKSAVGRPWERKFLGFTYTRERQPRRRIAPAALERLKGKLKEMTSRKRGGTLEQIVGELSRYLRGWQNYFGFCQTPTVLQKIGGWLRHRLRCLIWKRWKRSSTRFQRLRELGLSTGHAKEGAGNGSKGPWRMSASPPLQNALSIRYFRNLGLPDLMNAMNA